jgi:hypothetical protein
MRIILCCPPLPPLPTLHTSLPSKTQAFNKVRKQTENARREKAGVVHDGHWWEWGKVQWGGGICVTSFVDRSIVLYINSVSSPQIFFP